MNFENLKARCHSLTQDGPLAIGFRDAPIAFIDRMEAHAEEIDVLLRAPTLWNGTRSVHVPIGVWDVGEEEPSPDPLDLTIFWFEETLDNGAWQRWKERSDGSFDPPAIDDAVQQLLSEPLQRTRNTYLDRFQEILHTVGDGIVFYVRPDQWRVSPAPPTAWDPPKVLERVNLVRMAPYIIEHADVDQNSENWTIDLKSVHFPEGTRRVEVSLNPESLPQDMNPPGFLWWNLRSACEAWFDLHYSDEVPDEERDAIYAYGGWHHHDDGSWRLNLLPETSI